MFAQRLRAARDRGFDHVLRALLPSGSLGVDDPAGYHRAPWALARAGHLGAARRVLDHVARRWVTPDGDVRATRELRSVDLTAAAPARMPSWLCLGALALHRYALARTLAARLDALRAPASGHGRGAFAASSDDGVTDLAATLHVGAVHLATGRLDDATAAAAWIAALQAAQPRPDAFLLRRDASGSLVTLWSADGSHGHVVHGLGAGSRPGVLGDALAFLAELAPCVEGADRAVVLGASVELARFLARCAPHTRRPCDLASVARGAALQARALRDAGREGADELADLAVTAALRVADGAEGDGGFGPAGEAEGPAARIDRTAWVSACLHEVLAALDVEEPGVASPPAAEGWRVVLCNVPEVHAQRIADAVVSERLAACVNALGPVRSTYGWKGAVERDTEVTLLLKTTAARVAALTARVRALHPYELPEVIALPVEAREGHAPYLDWVAAQVAPTAALIPAKDDDP